MQRYVKIAWAKCGKEAKQRQRVLRYENTEFVLRGFQHNHVQNFILGTHIICIKYIYLYCKTFTTNVVILHKKTASVQ